MKESERVKNLKEAYSKGVIDIRDLEEELSKELRSDIQSHQELNMTIGIEDQIWMSKNKNNQPDPEKFKSVDKSLRLPSKPYGGMWTSTYTPDLEYDSDWIRWCSVEGFYSGRHKWLLEPKPALHVLVIDSLDDLKSVADIYEKKTYNGKDSTQISDLVLDFSKIAEDFDAMRLTKEGERDAGRTPIGEPDIYGWDSETVLSFRWNWSDYEYLGCSDIETSVSY